MTSIAPPGNTFDRLPPHDIEAEEAVLAACMVDAESMARAAALLSTRDFFRGQNASIFAAELHLHAAGKLVDLITVSHELSQRNELENVGGMSELSRMIAQAPVTIGAGAEFYAGIVREQAARRELIRAGHAIMAKAYDGTASVEQSLADSEAAIGRIRLGAGFGGSGRDAGEATLAAHQDIVEFLNDPRRIRGFSTPWWRLNYMLDGLVPGRLITWGAATSVGKSLAVQNICRELAVKGIPALLFTTEMTPEEVVTRLAYMHAKVDPFEVRKRGEATDEEKAGVLEALEVVRGWPLRFEPGIQTPSSIRSLSKLYVDARGIRVIVVDHIGQGFIAGEGEKEHERIGSVTSALKNLAADLDVVVLAVSHVNRDSRRENRLLELRDLFGSVHIEQDSSQVVLLTPVEMRGDHPFPLSDQEATHQKAANGGVDVWFHVAKNRFGGNGGFDLFLSWARDGGRFVQVAPA